jgi:hypothetical protein
MNADNPRYFSAHQMTGAHEFVSVKLMVILLFYCGVNVFLAAVANLLFMLAPP